MQLNFDARTVAPQQPMEPVPEGWYPAMIVAEEPKQVANKPACWYLALTMEILDGQFKGRKLFSNLNLGNDNQQAVEIAHRELSAICHVTGQFVVQDTAVLMNKPFQVKVNVANGRNEVKGYKDMNGNDPGKTGAAPAQPTFAAPPQQHAPAAAPQQPQAPAGWGAPPQAPAAAAPAAWAPPAQPQAPQQAWQPPAQAAQAPQAPAAAPWGAGAPAPAAQAPAAAAAAPWGQAPATAAPGAAPWQR